jgi:hypothetical protein
VLPPSFADYLCLSSKKPAFSRNFNCNFLFIDKFQSLAYFFLKNGFHFSTSGAGCDKLTTMSIKIEAKSAG